MSEYLPARTTDTDRRPLVVSGPLDRERSSSGLASSLGRAVIDLAPDILRLFGRRERGVDVARSAASRIGATGVTLSEVEMDLRIPFVRRVVVRRASSWSVAPDVLLAEQSAPRRSRLGVGVVSLAALAVAGLVAARRSGQLGGLAAQAQRMLQDRADVRIRSHNDD